MLIPAPCSASFVKTLSGRREQLACDMHNPYGAYPARVPGGSLEAFWRLLVSCANSREWTLFHDPEVAETPIVGLKISEWDREHFGLGMASLQILHWPHRYVCEPQKRVGTFLEMIARARSEGVRFLSVRVNEDDLHNIHALEQCGFRYYETIIWPVAKCARTTSLDDDCLRVATVEDLPLLRSIARQHQYQRGHYHCDGQLDPGAVNEMYAKWIDSAFGREETTILVFEQERRPVGYFVVKLDGSLSECLGYTYGRMQSLALDASCRGQGLGKRFFSGATKWLAQQGADYIDSGYASKNHISARLHSSTGFLSARSEITMHLWTP